LDERKKSEVLAFFWFIVSVLILLSLLSYTPEDVGFEISTPNSPAKNFVGIAGAYIAWALILLFGKTSYFLVPLFLFWGVAKWAGKKSQKLWLKIFATVIFFTSACALFSLVAGEIPIERFGFGGLIGFFTGSFLSNLFGNAGIFVALSLFILSIILATELLILQMTAGVIKKSKTFLPAGILKWAPTPEFKDPRDKKDKMILAKPAPALKPRIEPAAPTAKEAVKEKPKEPLKEPLTENSRPQIKLSIPKPPEPKPAEPKPAQVIEDTSPEPGSYQLPPLDLLQTTPALDQSKIKGNLEESSSVLENTLRDFGIDAKVVEVEQGPTITRYELQPAAGVKVQKITSLENDIALAMRAASVRIIAPIPGKSRVGIEVPNMAAATVYIREVLSSYEFQNEKSKIAIAIGKDTAGASLVCNLADMPHLLIAGATNTGKSVCINSIISSVLFKSSPEEVKFLMIDPKMVELHFYNDLPHLICPVVTDKSKAPGALGWLVSEMERRYRVLSKVGAKNILGFNQKVENKEIKPETLIHNAENNDEPILVKKMPYIVLIIDELADLMMASAQEVETAITRLAQLARAVGIHMILATQRPSVDVITGVIKANFPARIAFQVASKVDSRTILDENGADKLLGRGDLLLMDPRKSKLVRAQGAWVQDSEIEKLTSFIKKQRQPVYQEGIIQSGEKKQAAFGDFKRDEVYEEAKRIVLETGQASVSMVQRRLGLGYTRAARLIDMMEEDGVVGPYRGAKPREILVERPSAGAKEEQASEAS
jgi:S-DNA-T family DNA segregation ATPase FtsK/SpoIIIE